MMEFISGVPENVLAVAGKGTVTDEDYKRVLIPAAEEKIKKFGRVDVLYYLGPEFEHFDAKAMLDDAMIGLKHRREWGKIAVVTDVDWIRRGVRMFGFMATGPVAVYPNSELEKAKGWVGAKH